MKKIWALLLCLAACGAPAADDAAADEDKPDPDVTDDPSV